MFHMNTLELKCSIVQRFYDISISMGIVRNLLLLQSVQSYKATMPIHGESAAAALYFVFRTPYMCLKLATANIRQDPPDPNQRIFVNLLTKTKYGRNRSPTFQKYWKSGKVLRSPEPDHRMAADETDINFNVYVGSEGGVLKAIYYGTEEETPCLKNFHSFTKQEKANKGDIVSLNWGFEDDEKELIVGCSNGVVKIYNTKVRAFLHGTSLPIDAEKHGRLVSVYNYENNFIYGTSNGRLLTWNYVKDSSKPTEICTGAHLAKLTRCPTDTNIYATGGKETELQVWNLETPDTPIFKAKNVPHDFLDLRVPVWVQDITFLREATDLLAISTRYGQVRLYDTRAQNRPVVDMQYLDHPLMAISTVSTHNRQVLVGSSRGTLGQIDLRSTKGSVAQQYDGFVGGIRSIYAHPTRPIFTSCGLDRHVYLHELRDKKPIKKVYLKMRLQCIIMSKTLDSAGPNHAVRNVSSDVLPIECKNANQIRTPAPPTSHSSQFEDGVECTSLEPKTKKRKQKH